MQSPGQGGLGNSLAELTGQTDRAPDGQTKQTSKVQHPGLSPEST